MWNARTSRSASVLRGLRLGLKQAWRAVRRVWFRLVLPLVEPGIRLGRGVDIGPRTELRITSGGSIIIEDGVSLECDVLIYAEHGEVRIGRNGFVGRGSQIVAHERSASDPTR